MEKKSTSVYEGKKIHIYVFLTQFKQVVQGSMVFPNPQGLMLSVICIGKVFWDTHDHGLMFLRTLIWSMIKACCRKPVTNKDICLGIKSTYLLLV